MLHQVSGFCPWFAPNRCRALPHTKMKNVLVLNKHSAVSKGEGDAAEMGRIVRDQRP